MSDKMLIDASHQEETRVVVVRGNRIDEFDFESEHKKQIKGNIYLARVTRVEPSLQAAFVEYGGNRHGFLAFSEIHPDYYQIPVADRQALLEAEAQAASEEDEEDDNQAERNSRERQERSERSDRPDRNDKSRRNKRRGRRGGPRTDDETSGSANGDEDENVNADGEQQDTAQAGSSDEGSDTASSDHASDDNASSGDDTNSDDTNSDDNGPALAASVDGDVISEAVEAGNDAASDDTSDSDNGKPSDDDHDDDRHGGVAEETREVESIGSEDALEEVPTRQRTQRRQYNIQEVIKRRQILLVQVVKEERGNKGAALTTYLSLAGRYSVLMPNTARGGGISRKITNIQDRKRLKDIVKELEVPKGMGVILRTAGANRTKAEVKRDYEYLMRLWENVRSLTLESSAPTLVYEEGSLIKRSIRDLYNKDISEVLVAGENGYREAKDFMRMLMPSHAKVVQPYRDPTPIFARNGIEAQLDRLLQPQVTLKSGGYIIINQTEALVAIDVNSGRSTREHSIEDTALQTNLEAAEEVARQLRLRDLAGLVVVDFIDMEEKRNNRAVEKRLKDCLKDDRARIQVGHISHFGLLEMSRQRIRASVLESTTQMCTVCGGTGHVRSDSSLALHVIRSIEEYILRHSQNNIIVRTPVATALYVLNHKRQTLAELELRFGLTISIEADDNVGAQHLLIEKGSVALGPVAGSVPLVPVYEDEDEDEDIIEDIEVVEEEAASETPQPARDADGDASKKRRRRRRRRGGRDQNDDASASGTDTDQTSSDDASDDADGDDNDDADTENTSAANAGDEEERRKRRRRGRRGGRKNRRGEEGEAGTEAQGADDAEGSGDTVSDDASSLPESAVVDVTQVIPESVEAEAVAAVVEEKPAKKRAPRRKKVEAAETSDDAVVSAEAAVEADAPVAEEAEAPVKTRARKAAAPKKPRKTTKKAAAEDGVADDAAQAEPTAEPVVESPVVETVAVEAEVGAPAAAPEPVAPKDPVITSSGSEEKTEEDTKPKRGWWRKKDFF